MCRNSIVVKIYIRPKPGPVAKDATPRPPTSQPEGLGELHISLFVYGYPGRRHGKSEDKFRSKPRYVGNSCFAHRSFGPSDQGLQVSSILCPSMHMSPPKLGIGYFKINDGKPGRRRLSNKIICHTKQRE